jgi:hypothetical protein
LTYQQVIQEVFKTRPTGLEWVPFPDKSGQVPDRPALTLVVISPEHAHGDPGTRKLRGNNPKGSPERIVSGPSR